MIILPAIDIIEGQPVRLYQGDYGQKEIVGDSVPKLADRFVAEGASYLHLVDLDGAKAGHRVNDAIIIETKKNVNVSVEVGGGIRSLEDIAHYVENGIDRVILGTIAMEDEALLKEAIARYGSHIAVGIDCKNGYVYGRGWLQGSSLYYVDFAKHLEELGVKTIIVTDISKDGTMQGPNTEMLQTLKEQVHMQIVASGGIRDIEDIRKLKEMNLYGAISGKAMVHGTLDLKEAIALCKEG